MGERHRSEIHGTRNIKSQSLSGVCTICNKSRIFLKDIQKDYFNYGVIENYTKMLITCFNIRLFNSGGKAIEICESCIRHLRDACSFRKKVEAAGKTVYQKPSSVNQHIKTSHVSTNKTSSKTNENLLYKSNNSLARSKESLPQLRDPVKSRHIFAREKSKLDDISKNRPLPLLAKSNEKLSNEGTVVAQAKDSASYCGGTEDNDVKFSDDIIEILSDGESSTTSEQMKIATGYWKEIEEHKNWKRFVVPFLEFSCRACPVCGEKFETYMKLAPHYDNHFPNFLCEICGMAYVKLKTYTAHMKMHSGVKYPCKLCNRQYASPNGVYSHIKAHHKKLKLFSCYKCDERFHSAITRRKHLSTIHDVQSLTHPCPNCGKIFFSAPMMRMHIKKTHQKLKNFDCPDCEMQFFDKRALNEHVTKHSGVKNYHCDFCGKAFGRKKSLTEHLKIHNNIKKHKCDVCEKAFVQKCALKSHMRIHTKDF